MYLLNHKTFKSIRYIYYNTFYFLQDINLTGGKAPKHPVNFNTLLNSFEKLLLVKALKEEKVIIKYYFYY